MNHHDLGHSIARAHARYTFINSPLIYWFFSKGDYDDSSEKGKDKGEKQGDQSRKSV